MPGREFETGNSETHVQDGGLTLGWHQETELRFHKKQPRRCFLSPTELAAFVANPARACKFTIWMATPRITALTIWLSCALSVII